MEKQFLQSKDRQDALGGLFDSKSKTALSANDTDSVNGRTYTYTTRAPSVADDDAKRVDLVNGVNLSKPADRMRPVRSVFFGEEKDLFSENKTYVSKGEQETKPSTLKSLLEEAAGGVAPTAVSGSLNRPNIHQLIDNTSLFIDETPMAEDIRQRSLGDCYFLAALLSIIQNDSEFFKDVITLSGNTVTTRLYYQTNKKSWSKVSIKTPYGITERDGVTAASNYRISQVPKSKKWSAKFSGTQLNVLQNNYYQAALWVNCLENAYSVYAKEYGQYGRGRGRSDREANPNGERYDQINGGFAGNCLHIFYGDKASDKEMTKLAKPSDKRDLLTDNKKTLENMLALAKSKNDPNNHVHMFASTTDGMALERLIYHSEQALNEFNTAFQTFKAAATEEDDKKLTELEEAKSHLEMICACAQNYSAKPKTGFIFKKANPLYISGESQSDYKERMRNTINDATDALSKNNSYKSLNLPTYTDLKVTAAGLVQKRGENISIYTGHAYNIENVVFLDKDGKSLNAGSIDEVISKVDIESSHVTLQNPHAQTKKVYNGEREQRIHDGRFDMTLREFLVGIGRVQFATSSK